MESRLPEQRNSYKGDPERPWIKVFLHGVDGSKSELELLADTGNPCALIVDLNTLRRIRFEDGPIRSSNFGWLEGGWVEVEVPEFGTKSFLLAFGSDEVVQATRRSCEAFAGLAGLPLLRAFEFGGDADDFWVRLAIQ